MLLAIAPWFGLARAAATGCSTTASTGAIVCALHTLLDRRFQAPGGVLRLECDGKADIRVSPGEHESVSIQAEGPADGMTVQVEQQEQRQLIVLRQSPAGPAAITALAPERWCTIEASTHGGRVQVDKLVEADLRVTSRGGDVVVGSARGGEVRLDASCPGAGARQAGALKVREVSASQVWLLGGAAELQRVVGRDVRISVMQAQGAATIGVMYADRAAVQTGGAALQVGQLNCTESAEVCTSGGSVSISNVDSSVSVSTAGGSIQVHLSDKVRSVSLDSGGGDVAVTVSPSIVARLQVDNAGAAPSVGAGLVWHVEQPSAAGTGSGTVGLLQGGAEEVVHHRQPARSPADLATISISGAAGGRGGRVTISTLSWQESIKRRMALAKEQQR